MFNLYLNPMMIDNFFAPHCPRRGWGPFRSRRCRRRVADLTEDILNSMAIAQLMFGPENVTDNKSIHQQSELSATVDKDKFQANFDVLHFKPEEITVKVSGENTVTIEAKHEEKQDEHGHIYRHFIRKYDLPENCDVRRLESKLSSDGILTIMAPLIVDKQTETRTIPIIQTGQPATLAIQAEVEQKKPEKNLQDQSTFQV